MPIVPFESLPEDARCWVFGARAPLDEVDAPRLLGAVDQFLRGWQAHGQPLVCAREFRDEHFLVVGVDERASGASGCSVDELFRVLQGVEQGIGTSMVGGGVVHFRDADGFVHACTATQFEAVARDGVVDGRTEVFDTTVTRVGTYRAAFVGPAGERWQAALLGVQTRK